LGQLIALYEHITFVQGVGVGHRFLDQLSSWAVGAVSGDQSVHEQDASTRGLIAYYREHRS
jgi:glucose-6-phosphate isomerase